MSYLQGFQARSWIEYSLLKKYFVFLLVNVVFMFLVASTYLELIRDLANSPAKVPEKLALALRKGNAKHFFLSYVIFQGGLLLSFAVRISMPDQTRQALAFSRFSYSTSV